MAIATEKMPAPDLDQTFNRCRHAVMNLRVEPVQERKKRLSRLRRWIHENRNQIHEALYADFRKPSLETDATEIFHVLNEIRTALDDLDQWTSPKKIDAPFFMLGTRSYIRYEPRGVCLIIAPWNYPFNLAIGPLVSALAAGNCAIIKPSEVTPNVSALLKKMSAEIFEPEVVSVCEGGPEMSQHLISLPFDHIFFTGSSEIGKVVMKAAAENLTSVTLELGGKSPAIVTESANLKDAAERIAVGKFVNNGQTCIAPDYVLVDEKISGSFLPLLIEKTKKYFADNNDFETSASYCRIVNEKHFLRIRELIREAVDLGAKVEWDGPHDQPTRFIHPVVMTLVPESCRLMNEEIFGPVLPVVTYKSIEEAIDLINQKPKALALYIFDRDVRIQQRVLSETSSGTACINDCAIQFLHHKLPFGGVNNSGIGKSHGFHGFQAFSNEKPVLKQKRGYTSVKVFYPPYTRRSGQIMDWFLKFF